MTRTEDFRKAKKQREQNSEFYFWLLWFVVCAIGWWFWEPILWLILVPIVRYMIGDWKKENEYINNESQEY